MTAGKGQRRPHPGILWGGCSSVPHASVLCFCLHFNPSQAIRELQEEVSRLRLRLEDSLHRPPQGSPAHPVSVFDRPARTRGRPADSPATWGSHYGRWVTSKLSPLSWWQLQRIVLAGLWLSPDIWTQALPHPSLPHSFIHSL